MSITITNITAQDKNRSEFFDFTKEIKSGKPKQNKHHCKKNSHFCDNTNSYVLEKSSPHKIH